MANETFIAEIIKIASIDCGKGFGPMVSKVLKSNETALKETWQTILPTDLTKNDRNNLTIDTKIIKLQIEGTTKHQTQ